ncbi:hypothetical protein QR680_004106 [Steinernema hermaphroditum]|uniref:Uncharacterized protein n=1 Tax=Steinernema hermaphroditum TaxID=289476 RepID=A0AA39HMP2_9BILA|nr:hypothetical protein QR680_004106 [Steinernema hermaphroditum]
MSLHNDFAYLANDIIKDILELFLNPQNLKSGLFDNILKINGPWSAVVKNYSYLEFLHSDQGYELIVCTGNEPGRGVLPRDAGKSDRVRNTVCSDSLPKLRDLHFLLPLMTDRLSIRGTLKELNSMLELFPVSFSELVITGRNYSTHVDEVRKLENLLTERLKSRHLRSFICYLPNQPDQEFTSLDDSFRCLVTKPDFEELTTNFAIGFNVIIAAIETWRARPNFTVLGQKIKVSFRTPHGAELEWMKRTFPDWTTASSAAWKWTEPHPTDPDRCLKIGVSSDSRRIGIQFCYAPQDER